MGFTISGVSLAMLQIAGLRTALSVWMSERVVGGPVCISDDSDDDVARTGRDGFFMCRVFTLADSRGRNNLVGCLVATG